MGLCKQFGRSCNASLHAEVWSTSRMTVNNVDWCSDYECTVVDVTFEGSLTTSDDMLVNVHGFVNGTGF